VYIYNSLQTAYCMCKSREKLGFRLVSEQALLVDIRHSGVSADSR